jgi:hypothetical protein|tara:strand:+ start:149 stop:943 length:795 start_codon:yes stop_codon:yes gene_type:complete
MDDSQLLRECFKTRRLPMLNPGGGSWGARAGLAYELFMTRLPWTDYDRINSLLRGETAPSSLEDHVIYHVLSKAGVTFLRSAEIREVPDLDSGGQPKTDVWLVINAEVHVKMSVKRSHASSVAVSEFDVDTMAAQIGLTNPALLYLMRKHQTARSAKYFSQQERERLAALLAPHRRSLINWALSGCKEDTSDDPRHANFIVMFKTDPDGRLLGFATETLNDSVEHLSTRSSGFNTGLSWTYATGSGSTKIQFKAPVTKPQVVWG